ncbi:hypothetical protein BOQ63_007360 (plasmid) [Streptomyces viridifaciens]|nr:hypothetical protein CP971_34510 [Streptomyces viridifaciens]UKZ03881.1 hypothetical protein BOQ63_007360 [Streptomyces viridifaciens]
MGPGPGSGAPAWPAWPRANERELVRFVTPRASLWQPLDVSRFDLSHQPDRCRAVAAAIYNALSGRDIRYALEEYHPSAALQTIRKPAEVLEAPREGTCLDLAALFCGLCLAYDLLPVLVVVDGHAFAMVCTTHGLPQWNGYDRPGRELFADGPITNASRLVELVDSGAYLAVECTGFARSDLLGKYPDLPEARHRTNGLLPFDQAVAAGREQLYRADRPLRFAIDIATAHYEWRIEPHPVEQLDWAAAEPKQPRPSPGRQATPQLFDPGQMVDKLVYQLLKDSFTALPVLQGTPTQWLCRGLRVRRGSPDTDMPPTLDFHFEVEEIQSRRPELRVSLPTISRWRGIVETQPVIIILASIHHLDLRGRFWMLCFHDWLIQNTSTVPSSSSSEIPMHGFQQIDGGGENLHRLLIREAERATSMDGARWRTLKDYSLIPVDEETFLEFMDFSRFFEIPTEVYKRLAIQSKGQLTRSLRRYLQQRGSYEDTLVQEWLASIDGVPVPAGLAGFDRRQFRRFVRFVNQGGQGVRLPRYRGLEVGGWRTFVSMYPESLIGLQKIITTSPHGNDVAFAAAMLPMLALSNDPNIENRAHEALDALKSRAQDFKSYRVRRELLRAPAEATGDPHSMEKLIDLMRREGAHGMERRFLADYGWTADIVELNIRRKIDSPTLRDTNLKAFYAAMGDVIGR